MRINVKRALIGGAIALAAAGGPLLTGAANAAPPGTPPVGPLTMTPSTGTGTTNFLLKPTMNNNPNAAFCPGDSATGNYRWQTFITPATVDPATLTYDSTGPVPQAGEATWPLFDVGGSPVVAQTTGVGDGLVSTFAMNLAVFDTEGLIPDGDYKIGIACTLGGVTQTYWSIPVSLVPGAAIINYQPTTPGPDIPEAPLSVLLPLTGLAAVGGFVVLRRRQSASALAA